MASYMTAAFANASIYPNSAKDAPAPRQRMDAALGKPRAARSTRKPNDSAQDATNLETRDGIIVQHLPLVRAIAAAIRFKIGAMHGAIDFDDLVQAGTAGLIDATNKYDSTKQVPFSAYAKHRIRGAILDSLRELDWASRDIRRQQKLLESASGELAVTLQRTPTESEIAARLSINLVDLRRTMLDCPTQGPISLSLPLHYGEDRLAVDVPCKPEMHPDSICARGQMCTVLNDAMRVLPDRYRSVVSMYYMNEMSMKEIGRVIGVNESRVSQIHKSALAKMAVQLEANGITSPEAVLG
jgi:RNA polymerase sigma factor for flagellar operon FliA